MSIWLMVALCGLVLMVVFVYAACYVSGSISELERQAELQARMMRLDVGDETEL